MSVAVRVIACLDVDAGRWSRASISRICVTRAILSNWPPPMTRRGGRTLLPGRHRVVIR